MLLPALPRLNFLLASLAISAAFAVAPAHGSKFTGAALESVFETTSLAVDAIDAAVRPVWSDGRSTISQRWQQDLERFERSDRAHAPSEGGVVIVGSSSIALWNDLESTFPQRNVIRRGLGGARMDHIAGLVDHLVLPYRPRSVVVYAGDNDLAEGVAPQAILAAYVDFVARIHRASPQTRISFVSIKPSPARHAQMRLARETNALIEAHASTDRRLAFVNIFTPMLDSAGIVRNELFAADGLHLNATGYALWSAALDDHLN